MTARQPGGPLFWTGVGVGAALVAVGLAGIWIDRADTHPAELVGWLGGAGIAHDAVLAPVVVVVAWASRRLPDAVRLPVQLALAMSGLLTLLTWPLVQGWGRSASVPSALPLDYGRNLLAMLAAIWLVTGVAVLVRLRRDRQVWRDRQEPER